jgi:acetolactate synthase-1/2/3 large subunit
MVRNAVKFAKEEKPGPTHLELPEDIAAESLDGQFAFPNPTSLPIKRGIRPVCNQTAIVHAVELIREAKRPLICVAAGCQRFAEIGSALENMMTKLGLYAVTTQMGKGALNEEHPYYLGTTALSHGDVVHEALNAADLIINVGHDISEKPPFLMTHNTAPLVIHINSTRTVVDPVYFPHLDIVGDIAHSLVGLTEKLTPQPHWNHEPFRITLNTMNQEVFSSQYLDL